MIDSTEATPLSTTDRAIAAWESTAVQTFNPVLDDDTATAMWNAIVVHRASRDADAFATSARALVAAMPQSVRQLTDVVIDNLVAMHRATAAAPATTN